MSIDHYEVDKALRAAGSSWSAAQAHGLLCGRLALLGADGGTGWLNEVLDVATGDSHLHGDAINLLDTLFTDTCRQLQERQSEFDPLLPAESESMSVSTAALAEWCEGFLHGLVTGVPNESVKERLAAEPLSDIIKDLLELTRAAADDDDSDEDNEQALTELNEYLRVAVQLVYEELADVRDGSELPSPQPPSDVLH